MRDIQWSKTEREVARRAFDAAYRKECRDIAEKVGEMIAKVATPSDLWQIHDFLTEQRRQTDEKYDYRYSVLLFVFARLLSEGRVTEADLTGLREDKTNEIRYLANR